MKIVNPDAIKICDSCMICSHWVALPNGAEGDCLRFPAKDGANFPRTAAATRCGEFNKDEIIEQSEKTRIIKLLESGEGLV